MENIKPGQKVVALVNVVQVKAGSTYTVSSVNTVYYGADESPSPFSLFLVNERGAFVGCCYPHQVRAAEGV